MDYPPGSIPAQRRTTLVAFLALLIAVMVITVLMVLPYVLAMTMGGILAVLAQPVFQWLTGHHVPPRVAAALLAAGATFICAWIPLVGSTPVWLAGAIYLYVQDAMLKAILMVVLGLMTGLIDNCVRPLILQGRSNMHPLVSLVAIFGGMERFGILGVFLGPILAAVLIALLQIWPAVGQRFGLLPGATGATHYGP